MTAKINWHRYGAKLRHCRPVYTVSQKSEPPKHLQQPPQTCTDLNEILHAQHDIHFCHQRQIS